MIDLDKILAEPEFKPVAYQWLSESLQPLPHFTTKPTGQIVSRKLLTLDQAKLLAETYAMEQDAKIAEDDDLATLNWKCTSDHYKALFERHMADSTQYQALLFHSWKSLREQSKGLRRQAQKIKRLKQKLATMQADYDKLEKLWEVRFDEVKEQAAKIVAMQGEIDAALSDSKHFR